MRIALAALILGLACASPHAQTEKPATKQQRSQNPSFDPARPQDQRAKERVPGDPPPDHGGHTISKDAQPPKGQPSPAAKMQQEQAKQFQKSADDGRNVGCSAYPACSRPGLVCQGVARNYGNANVTTSKNDIISHCREANTPDTCDCARQCARVARCSIF